jgi:hypothetical protein
LTDNSPIKNSTQGDQIIFEILEILYVNRAETIFDSDEVRRRSLIDGLYHSEAEIEKAITNLQLKGYVIKYANVFSNEPWSTVRITKKGIDYYRSKNNVADSIEKRSSLQRSIYNTKSKKKIIFISHRGRLEEYGKSLHRMFKDYNNGMTFEPFHYAIDMTPGLWLEQLENALNRTDCFVPLITNDYFKGPISQAEYYDALRRYYSEKKIAIVPVLLDVSSDEIEDTFLAGFTFKKLPLNTNSRDFLEKFMDLVDFLLKQPK